MSLFPYTHPIFRTGDWWDNSTVERLFDQDFGMSMLHDDPFFHRSAVPYWMRSRTRPVVENLERGMNEVRNDPDKFAVNMDVSHFTPEEIKVKIVDNNLTVEGKHEEKVDPHGFISRSFKRRYVLPKDVDPAALTSKLTNQGVLHVEAPKKPAVENSNERTIPIQFGVQSIPKAIGVQSIPKVIEKKIENGGKGDEK